MVTLQEPTVFISDSHLPLIPHPERDGWAPRLINFLTEIVKPPSTLVIVGDLFDFWFEWRYSIPSGAFRVLSTLRNLSENGVRIIYLGGNHDGHVGSFLEDEVGVVVSRKPIDAEIGGKRFHIVHGDGIAPSDRGYRLLRCLIRWKFTESIYRLVHPDLGIWIANKISKISRVTVSKIDTFGAEPYRQYAVNKLDDGFNFVIMGHRHQAEYREHSNGAYVAIGDWLNRGSYGYFIDGEMKLKYFPQLPHSHESGNPDK